MKIDNPTQFRNNMRLQFDNIMQNMTDELARQYINNLVQADSSIPNLLREGNINLEYSVFLPNTNSYYTYRTRNNDSSTNNI